MVNVYVLAIQKGLKTIEEVPISLREKVQAKLDELA